MENFRQAFFSSHDFLGNQPLSWIIRFGSWVTDMDHDGFVYLSSSFSQWHEVWQHSNSDSLSAAHISHLPSLCLHDIVNTSNTKSAIKLRDTESFLIIISMYKWLQKSLQIIALFIWWNASTVWCFLFCGKTTYGKYMYHLCSLHMKTTTRFIFEEWSSLEQCHTSC